MIARFICCTLLAFHVVSRFANAQHDLYFGPATPNGLYRWDIDMPASFEQIVPGNLVNTSNGIAIDYIGRKLYWIADTQFGSIDKIRRSNLDGSNVELFKLPSGQPADLEIDPYLRKLYWPERETNSINVINLDGTGQQTLITTQEPRGMDIDLLNGHLYWVELESNRVRRSNLDGTQIIDLITTGINRPFDVTVDPINGRLYWVELGSNPDNQHGNVWKANLNGTNPMLVVDGQIQPTDLVIDYARNSIYWPNEDNSSLMRADLDGTNVSVLPGPSTDQYRSLALDVAPVPEPNAVTLALLWISGIIALRRRHSSPQSLLTAR